MPTRDIESREIEFWNEQAALRGEDELNNKAIVLDAGYDRPRLKKLGAVAGKKVLDVGCGTGRWSVYLAKQGAEVWAIDISARCIEVVEHRAKSQDVSQRVHASVMSVNALEFGDDSFDLVHGLDIIHHVDPALFGNEVYRVLKPSGRAVFGENSANNPLLMLLRNRLCGRFGISKWSSDDEHPLTDEGILRFAQRFRRVEVEYPDFRFFHYLDAKLFNHRNKPFRLLCRSLDVTIYWTLPFLRKYSYRQLIVCQK